MDGQTEVVPYLAFGALIMYAQRALKRFDWYSKFVTAFPAADRWVHRIVAGALAFIAAVGIHYTWQGDATTGWNIHIAIPNLAALGHGTWDFVNVYIFQQLSYDVTRRPPGMPHDQPVTDDSLKKRMG